MKMKLSKRVRQLLPLIVLVVLLSSFMIGAAISHAGGEVEAGTTGFGAAFAYAQTIADVSFTQTGGMGNADSSAHAWTGASEAWSTLATRNDAAAFAQSISSPFGSTVFFQGVSSFNGVTVGRAWTAP